jgi:hypothetical protein
VIEANSSVFSLGMSVAPVTDWAFYDSIYTERYMSTPQLNAAGYARGQISGMAGFHHADYLLAHGSGDDNGPLYLLELCPSKHVAQKRSIILPQCISSTPPPSSTS